jgi:tRNA (guanine37-N1)-methyltransferase
VGPLAVRAAKKGVNVIANDLNPSCYEYLVRNAKLNGVEKRIMCWNLCAREAVRKIIRERLSFREGFQVPNHFYMNLPVDAI